MFEQLAEAAQGYALASLQDLERRGTNYAPTEARYVVDTLPTGELLLAEIHFSGTSGSTWRDHVRNGDPVQRIKINSNSAIGKGQVLSQEQFQPELVELLTRHFSQATANLRQRYLQAT